MEKEVHQCEEDNTQYDILQKFLTLLQGHMMLETFKKQKIVRYIQMLKVVAYKEVHNSALAADMANEVLSCHIDRKDPPQKTEIAVENWEDKLTLLKLNNDKFWIRINLQLMVFYSFFT